MLKKQHYAKNLALIRFAVKYYLDEMKRELEHAKRPLEGTFLGAEMLGGGCGDAQRRWTPSPGVWFAGGCIAHLNRTIRRVCESGDPERSAGTEFRYGMLERWFGKSMEPAVKIKLKTPKVFVTVQIPPKIAQKRLLRVLGDTARPELTARRINSLVGSARQSTRD